MATISYVPDPPRRLQVTLREAAHLLAFSSMTIRRLIKAGELTATGHGQSLRVTMTSLEAYMQRHERRA